MKLKAELIRAKIERLDPLKDASVIAALRAELAKLEAVQERGQASQPDPISPREEETVGPELPASGPFPELSAEVHIRSPRHGDIYLVPKRTGAARFEILPDEMALLAVARRTLDATIVEVRSNVPARL